MTKLCGRNSVGVMFFFLAATTALPAQTFTNLFEFNVNDGIGP